MKRGLIQNRLAMASKADYTNALDVQNFIQNLANYESLLEWAWRPDEPQKIGIAGLPSRLYEREKVRAWKWYSFLIP